MALDPKRRLYVPGWEPLEGTKAIVRGWPTGWPRVIGRPGLLEDPTDWLNTCCRRAYQVENCVVAVDELAGIANASSPPVWLDVLQTRGRELGITTVICSQRPRRIPVTVLSEASHVFVFGLNTPADRDYVADTIGDYWAPTSKHGYLYWRPDMASPIECAPIPT